MLQDKWWEAIDNVGGEAGHMRLARLAEWMLANSYSASDVVSMLREPWKWTPEAERAHA